MSDPQDRAEELDDDVRDTGEPEEDEVWIQGEVGDLSELLVNGQDAINTGHQQSPEEAALHVVDTPDA